MGPYQELHQRTKSREIVWHYTSWEGLAGILESNELWATDYRCLNDLTECMHALEVARGRFGALFGYLNYRIEEISSGRETLTAAYVTSLSYAFDSLGQWRAYAQGSAGVALGFSKNALERLGELYGFKLRRCVYTSAEKETVFREMHDRWQAFYDDGVRRADAAQTDLERHLIDKPLGTMGAAVFQEFMSAISLRFKHPSFEEEDEVRLATGFEGFPGDMGHYPSFPQPYGSRKRGTMEVPYYRMPLSVAPARERAKVSGLEVDDIPHPLVSALVGPTSGSRGVAEVRELLHQFRPELEQSVLIAGSGVPLRY
jgi:hypothetical protein